MKIRKFTSKNISEFQCPPDKTQCFLYEEITPSFGLRANKSNKKTFISEGSLNGKTIRAPIGDIRTWTIGDARKEAIKFRALVDQGIDPRKLKAERRAKEEKTDAEAKAKKQLVGDLWAAYLSHYECHWGKRHLTDHLNLSKAGGQPKKRGKGTTAEGVLYALLQLPISHINADLLTEWVKKEAAARPNNARQGYELFRGFWRWCAGKNDLKGIMDAGAVEDKDLRKAIPSRKNKRFDVLQKSQLLAWFDAVRGLSNPVTSTYLQALILTGARREEMAPLRWADVDFQWDTLWVKDKVHKEGRKIPLTPYLAGLIAALPRRNEWVFSSPTAKSGHITEPRLAHNRALSIAGLNHITLHGLRRTFASLAEWVEIPQGVVAQIMGHSPNATAEKHYIHRPIELLAIWHDKYEKWILEQAGIEFDSGQKAEGLRIVK